jgi:hypothetical protein
VLAGAEAITDIARFSNTLYFVARSFARLPWEPAGNLL